MTEWRPILDAARAQAARAAVAAILDDLAKVDPEAVDDRGGDDPFVALLFAYAARELRDERWTSRAQLLFEHAIGGLGERIRGPTLFAGLAGVAWLDAHLDRTLRETPADELDDAAYEDIDEALVGALSSGEVFPYELIAGAAGFAVAWLERPRTAVNDRFLKTFVDWVDARALRVSDGLTWHTPPELLVGWQQNIAPNGYRNLGVAHGVPGLMVALARTAARGVEEARCRALFEGAARWVLAQREGEADFPTWTTPDGQRTAPTRGLAWCYGGLGLSLSLLSAAKTLKDARWASEASAMLEALAGTRVPATAELDAGLCHGAAGNAHLFNRAFQLTGRAALKDAALHWFDVALGLRGAEGLGGFRVRTVVNFDPGAAERNDDIAWVDEARWLTGSTGIGLALLAGFSAIDPGWDRLLCASG